MFEFIESPTFMLLALLACAASVQTLFRYLKRFDASNESPDEQTDELTDAADAGMVEWTETAFLRDTQFTKTMIVTHGDFDGFACGALLLRLYGDSSGMVFTTPRRLHRSLGQAARGLVPGDVMFIADIAMQQKLEPEIVPELKRLKAAGIKIIWIDHHDWPMGMRERTASEVFQLQVDPSAHSAAEMVRLLLPKDDLQADKILRFLHHGSFPADREWDDAWRMLLSELVSLRDYEITTALLKSWATGETPGPAGDYLIRRGRKRERLTEEISQYRHRKETTRDGRVFLVIDVRSRRLEMDTQSRVLFVWHTDTPSIMVGSKACRYHHADFCLLIWEDFRYSIYRGEDRRIDFKPLFPIAKRDRFEFKVAGHHYAASITTTPRMRDQLKSLFDWHLPDATESLIALVKETF